MNERFIVLDDYLSECSGGQHKTEALALAAARELAGKYGTYEDTKFYVAQLLGEVAPAEPVSVPTKYTKFTATKARPKARKK